MELRKTTIKNFKGIENLDLNFNPGINILLGGNGVGKTSVLEALSITLSDFFNGIKGITKKGIEPHQIRFDTHNLGDASQATEYFSTSITSDILCYGQVKKGEILREDNTSARTKYRGKEIAEYALRLCNDKEATLPLLRYFSARRLAPPKREDYGKNSKSSLNDRVCGYIGCMEDTLDLKALESWCVDMELEALHLEKTIREYEGFKNIVAAFMSQMLNSHSEPSVYYSKKRGTLVYQEDGRHVPISYLSAGYQSLLWMILDMAYRIAQLNPAISDYSAVPGIVLIDEIDMHLHPAWQWRIANVLHKVFPKIQFILATHSPIIVSSAKNAHLISLAQESVRYLPNAYAYSVDDILESRQTSRSIPEELSAHISSFDRALNSGRLDEAKEILDNMTQLFGCANPSVLACQSTLELETLSVDS